MTLAALPVASQIALLRGGRPLPATLIEATKVWSAAVWAASYDASSAPPTQREVALALRPVFICGAPRSGTTLLRDLLDGHSRLAVLPTESQFYTLLEPMMFGLPTSRHTELLGREWIERLVLPPPHWLLGPLNGAEAYLRFAADFRALCGASVAPKIASWPLAAFALAFARVRASGAEMWVEKTPGHERHLARILHDFPGALVIHLVRNPVDVLASWKILQGQRWSLPAAGRFSARVLAPSYSIAAEADPRRHLIVRYEDLSADHQQTMRQIASFLGISFAPSMCQPTVAGYEAASNTSFRDGRPKLTDVLSKAELAVLKLAVSGPAARMGYRLTS